MLVFGQKDLVFRVTAGDRDGLDHALGALGLTQQWSDAIGKGRRVFGSGYAGFADEVFVRLVRGGDRLDKVSPENRWAVRLHDNLSDREDWAVALDKVERYHGNRYVAASSALRFLKVFGDWMRQDAISNPAEKIQDLRQQLVAQRQVQRQQQLEALKQSLQEQGCTEEQAQAAQDAVLAQMQQGAKMDSPQAQESAMEATGEGVDENAIAQALAEGADGSSEKVEEAIAQTIAQGKAAREEVGAFEDQVDGYFVSAGIADGAKEASEAISELETIASGMGLGLGDANLDMVLLEKLMAMLAKGNSGKTLAKVMKIAGRLRPIADKVKATKTTEAQREVIGVSKGQTLKKMLPMEVHKMGAAPTMFAKDYLDENIAHYEMGGKEKMGRGPIVLCIDVSGSTQGLHYGKDNADILTWERAIALVLSDIALEQKRGFEIIDFESEVVKEATFEPLSSFQKIKRRDQKIRLLEHLSQWWKGGGTNFEEALGRAMELATSSKKHLKGADIVFITDGEDNLYEDWLEKFNKQKADKEVRVHAITIHHNEALARQTVETFADDHHHLDPERMDDTAANEEALLGAFGV